MSETDLNPPQPAYTPLPDAPGQGEPGDELTDPNLPPVPQSAATDVPDAAAAPVDADDSSEQPEPCIHQGGQP